MQGEVARMAESTLLRGKMSSAHFRSFECLGSIGPSRFGEPPEVRRLEPSLSGALIAPFPADVKHNPFLSLRLSSPDLPIQCGGAFLTGRSCARDVGRHRENCVFVGAMRLPAPSWRVDGSPPSPAPSPSGAADASGPGPHADASSHRRRGARARAGARPRAPACARAGGSDERGAGPVLVRMPPVRSPAWELVRGDWPRRPTRHAGGSSASAGVAGPRGLAGSSAQHRGSVWRRPALEGAPTCPKSEIPVIVFHSDAGEILQEALSCSSPP